MSRIVCRPERTRLPMRLDNSGRARKSGGRIAQGKRKILMGWGAVSAEVFPKIGAKQPRLHGVTQSDSII
jgi:hypothetical protein